MKRRRMKEKNEDEITHQTNTKQNKQETYLIDFLRQFVASLWWILVPQIDRRDHEVCVARLCLWDARGRTTVSYFGPFHIPLTPFWGVFVSFFFDCCYIRGVRCLRLMLYENCRSLGVYVVQKVAQSVPNTAFIACFERVSAVVKKEWLEFIICPFVYKKET